MPAQNRGPEQCFVPDDRGCISSAAQENSLVANYKPYVVARTELARHITKGKTWLEDFETREACGVVFDKTKLVFKAEVEKMISNGLLVSAMTSMYVMPAKSTSALVPQLTARNTESKNQEIDDDYDDVLDQSPEDFLEGVLSVQGPPSKFQTWSSNIKARVVKGKAKMAASEDPFDTGASKSLAFVLPEDDDNDDDDYATVEQETFEQLDRRIEKEEETKMRGDVDAALRRINDWENAWKEHWIDAELLTEPPSPVTK